MKINNREKIMLYVLLTVLLVYVGFIYLIEPQALELTNVEGQIASKEFEVQRLQSYQTTEANLDASISDMYNQIESTALTYFNTTPQEEIILLFNDFLQMPFVEESSISFGQGVENVQGIDFLKDTVTVSVSGDYLALVNMLKTVWDFPKEIQIESLNVSSNGEEINSTITFTLYTFMAESSVVDNLYRWYVDDLFYKEDPFVPYEENPLLIRYLYIGENEELFNYGKYFEFTDIEDHWLEAEIMEFLDAGYVYMDEDLQFNPDAPMTRGEFIVLLDSIYDWEDNGEEIDLTTFDDYDELGSMETSYAKAIFKGFLGGVIVGYSDNRLAPRDPMSYEQIELVMNRVKDTEDFSWTDVAADLTANKGVSSGRWSDHGNYITKAEALYLLYYFH